MLKEQKPKIGEVYSGKFTSEANFAVVHTEKVTSEEGVITEAAAKNIIALIGNRFMNGGYLSTEVLKKSYKQWDGTLHDINHMGTSTGFFLMQTDITYFIGWHSDVKFNKSDNSVSMHLNIKHNTECAPAWEAYIGLCAEAGRIPNVSVTYFGKRKFVPVSELPKEANWKKEGYGKDDLVPVLIEITPFCVSTVLEGRCGDKDGCGIRNTTTTPNDCQCDFCTTGKNEEDLRLEAELEDKRRETIKRIKEKVGKLEN